MSEKVVNAVAQWLRAEVDLKERSQQLGVLHTWDEATVRTAFIRAAEEIESLNRQLVMHNNE